MDQGEPSRAHGEAAGAVFHAMTSVSTRFGGSAPLPDEHRTPAGSSTFPTPLRLGIAGRPIARPSPRRCHASRRWPTSGYNRPFPMTRSRDRSRTPACSTEYIGEATLFTRSVLALLFWRRYGFFHKIFVRPNLKDFPNSWRSFLAELHFTADVGNCEELMDATGKGHFDKEKSPSPCWE